ARGAGGARHAGTARIRGTQCGMADRLRLRGVAKAARSNELGSSSHLGGRYGRVVRVPASVVSVINYKGGVGKTTLTANIGADLAARGRRVLLVDLDPQASLTFSFYRPSEWEEQLAGGRTVLHWFDSYPTTGVADPLRKYLV